MDLIGTELDAAVAKALGRRVKMDEERGCMAEQVPGGFYFFAPSTDWSQGGPIIEREQIALHVGHGEWRAHPRGKEVTCAGSGPTPLIAAMRAFVASKT